MIPIECPKCGRGGSVPPDRLNARLVCKACHSVFHLDNTGRMVMGEPQSFDMKSTKSRADTPSAKAVDFDLSQTWQDIPKPVKYGVPAVLLGVILYLNFGGGGSTADYESRAEAIIRSVISNDRSRVVSLSTSDSAEAAGKWFDLVHGAVEKGQIDNSVAVNPTLLSGSPDKDNTLVLMVVLVKNESTGAPVTITLPMKKEGGYWLMEGTSSLESAGKMASSSNSSTPNKR
jgi:hypothetical protein